MKTRLLLFVLLGCTYSPVQAQHLYNVWLRGTATCAASQRLSLSAELQHRRQSSIPGRFAYPDRSQLYSLRPWIRYNYTPRVQLSLSPLAWFRSFKLTDYPIKAVTIVQNEYRIAAAASLQYPLHELISITGRLGLEYRMFQGANNVLRSRYYAGSKFRISRSFGLTAFDELFLNLYSNKSVVFYDQNRIGLALGYTTASLDMDLGIIHIARNSKKHIFQQEENIFLNISYRTHARKNRSTVSGD